MFSAGINTIPHNEQRYDTVGDWYFPEHYPIDPLTINVSEMNNPDYEFLVGVHELIEAYLCKKRGIKEEDVTAFDISFKEKSKLVHDWEPDFSQGEPSKDSKTCGLCGRDDDIYHDNRLLNEPGNHPDAPYYKEHQFATKIEEQIVKELGVDWDQYDKTVNEL